MAALKRSEHTTYCPYKGDASYYSIPAGGGRSFNAVWTYETPFKAMAQIKDYVAFYPDRVDGITQQSARPDARPLRVRHDFGQGACPLANVPA